MLYRWTLIFQSSLLKELWHKFFPLKPFTQYPLHKYISHDCCQKHTLLIMWKALTWIRFQEKYNYSIVDRLIHEHNYYPDGTPKRGPNSRRRTNPNEEQHHLVQALLDQYNDDNAFFGVCPLSPSLPIMLCFFLVLDAIFFVLESCTCSRKSFEAWMDTWEE